MTEINYRGVETINYKTADLSDLKYIKIVYTDMYGQIHELKTEINYLSDDYLSLFVKKTAKKEEVEEYEEEIESAQEEENSEEGQTQTQSIKATSYIEYMNKMKEEKEREEKEREEKEAKEKEEEEKASRIYDVECPQEILLKFVIDDLLYIAKTSLYGVEIKATKVFFKINAPEILTLQQHRRFYRINLKRLCLLVATNNEGSASAFVSRSINLSAGGILINKLETMTDNKYIKLEHQNYETYNMVLVLEMDKILKLSARYVREEESKKSNRYAFEFIDMPEEKVDYISKYVIRKQLEELRHEYDIKNKKL